MEKATKRFIILVVLFLMFCFSVIASQHDLSNFDIKISFTGFEISGSFDPQ